MILTTGPNRGARKESFYCCAIVRVSAVTDFCANTQGLDSDRWVFVLPPESRREIAQLGMSLKLLIRADVEPLEEPELFF